MSDRRHLLLGAASLGLTMLSRDAIADSSWPSKPIRVINGYPPGAQTDAYARAYGDYVTQETGQPWILDFKAGVGGGIAAAEVARSAPDGYTLLFTTSSTLTSNRVLYRSLSYDAEKDFVIVSLMSAGSLPLIVNPKTGASTLAEYVAYARRNKASLGTFGPGSSAHIAIAELNRQYGLAIEPVHYRGAAPMWSDVVGGSIDGGISSYASALAVLQPGRCRAIASFPSRIAPLPGVASFVEQGTTSKAFELPGYQVCAAPAGTPIPVVRRLSELFVAAGKTERIRTMLATFGVDEPPLDFDASRQRYAAMAPVVVDLVRSLGLTPL